MEQLDRIAKDRGAATLAVEADLETLATLSRPNACIGYFDQHFAIIKWVDLDTKNVSLIDPPREYEEPFDRFRKRFSRRSLILGTPAAPPSLPRSIPWAMIVGLTSAAVGGLVLLRAFLARRATHAASSIALIIGIGLVSGCETKIPPTTPASQSRQAPLGLRIEPTHHHLGKVFASRPDRTVTLENQLINETTSPIRVIEVKKSCTCTSVALDPTTIPAGQSSPLKSTFELGSRPGPNHVSVELIIGANDPSSRSISYDWDVVTPMFAEVTSLDFGRLEPSQSPERLVKLFDREVVICPDCRLVADPNHGLITAEAKIDRSPEGVVHPADSESPGPERPLGLMTVLIRPGGDSGEYHQGVTLSLNCRGVVRAKLDLPIDWAVRPSFEAQPHRLWLGANPTGSRVSKRITIRSNDGTPLRIARVASEPPDFLAESKVSAENEQTFAVDLTFSIEGNPGLRRVSLIITHGEGGSQRLVVPVSYLIEAISPAPEKP